MANAKIVTYGPWQIPVKVTNCLCPDGKRRNVKLTREADTYCTIPAKLSFRGTSVTGFVTHCRISTCKQCGHVAKDSYSMICPNCAVSVSGNTDDVDDLEFIPYATGRNAKLFD